MKSCFLSLLVFCGLMLGFSTQAAAQRPGAGQTELSTPQRLDVLTSKLDSMRRSLTSAISSMTPASKSNDKSKPSADDPLVRLKGLEKEVSSTLNDVNDIRAKNDRAEKFDATAIDRLEASVTEVGGRVDTALQQTASARGSAASFDSSPVLQWSLLPPPYPNRVALRMVKTTARPSAITCDSRAVRHQVLADLRERSVDAHHARPDNTRRDAPHKPLAFRSYAQIR